MFSHVALSAILHSPHSAERETARRSATYGIASHMRNTTDVFVFLVSLF